MFKLTLYDGRMYLLCFTVMRLKLSKQSQHTYCTLYLNSNSAAHDVYCLRCSAPWKWKCTVHDVFVVMFCYAVYIPKWMKIAQPVWYYI